MNTQVVTEEVAEASEKIRGNLEVRILRSVPELEEVRNIWTAWNHHPNSDIDLYLLLLETRPQILRPHIIVLYRGGAPEAMLIGRIVNQRMELKIGYKTILKPKVKLLSFVTGGMLGNLSPDNCKAAVSEIVNCLRQRDADIAAFHNIPTHEPIYEVARRAPSFISRDHFAPPQAHWTLRLPDRVEEIFRGISTKALRNRRQEAQRLLRDHPGQVRVARFSTPSEVDRLVRDAEEVAKSTYHRGLGVGFTDCKENRRRVFFEAQNGRLRAYVLYVADRPSAFWILSMHHETLYGDFTGYDPELSKYSPGTFLLMNVIEDACRDSVKEIDFGSGDAWYKRFFCNHEWQEATVHIFGPTLKGLGFSLLRTPTLVADRIARRSLKQTGLLLRVKKTWRNLVRADKNHEPSREGNSLTDSRKAS